MSRDEWSTVGLNRNINGIFSAYYIIAKGRERLRCSEIISGLPSET
jgi:hypothetical protein